jgi:uncharacterized protein (DUF302 family)
MAAKGMVVWRSGYGPEETMNRIEDGARARGMKVFAHIDHAAIAATAGSSLDPTDLLIFGDVRAGAPLMRQSQMVGIDLPLKALVWRDSSGITRLAYTDVAWVAKRHGIRCDADGTVNSLILELASIARTAIGSP